MFRYIDTGFKNNSEKDIMENRMKKWFPELSMNSCFSEN